VRRVLVAFLVLGLASCGSLSDLRAIQGRGGDADKALEDGVRRLLDQPAIGFSYLSATSGSEFSVRMSGSLDLDSHAWVAHGQFTAFLAPAHDFELRSIGRLRWFDLAHRPGVPCWVAMYDGDDIPGLPAIDPDVPGFIAALEHLHGADWQVGADAWITAHLGLRDAARMSTSAHLAPSELAATVPRGGKVAVTVTLEDGVLHEVVMSGRELALALEAADARIAEEELRELESRDVRLTFGGPVQAVKRPDPSRVFDWVNRLPGCPAPEPEQASA